jgi:hypothetical protein
MAPEPAVQQKLVGLPLLVASPVDVGRLVRELEAIDQALMQLNLQKQELKMPKTSKLMDEVINLNKLNLLQEADRTRLKQFLVAVKQRAPLLHISFSADPSPVFTEKLMSWLRQNVHPLTLLTVGLQPNIGAGCMVRTNNKYFDFSLSKHFGENRELLMSKLRGSVSPAVQQPAVVQAPGPAPVQVVPATSEVAK